MTHLFIAAAPVATKSVANARSSGESVRMVLVPNARVNRRLPAKLVDVLLNDQLGWSAKALVCS